MNRSKKSGFTIVELVVVIAVIAILAAVAVPAFSNVIKKAEESAYLQEKQMQQIADSLEKIENENYLTWEDLEKVISEKLTENSDAQSVVRAVVGIYKEAAKMGNTSLTKEQVCKIIDRLLGGKLAATEIKDIIDEKMAEEDETQDDIPDVPTIPENALYVSSFNELKAGLNNVSVDYIVLNSDMKLSDTVVFPRDVILDLGGKTLYREENDVEDPINMFEVSQSAHVTVKNGTLEFFVTSVGNIKHDLFNIESGNEQNKSKLTLDRVNVYTDSSGQQETVSAVFLGSHTDVLLNESQFVVLYDKSADISTYEGKNAVVCVESGAMNTEIKMDGGRVEMAGNGYMHFVTCSKSASKVCNNISVGISDAEIILDNVSDRANGNAVVFDIDDSVSTVDVKNSKIVLDGANDYATGDFGAYLIKRKGTFYVKISFVDTEIILNKLNKDDAVEYVDGTSAFVGEITVEGNSYDERVWKWYESLK